MELFIYRPSYKQIVTTQITAASGLSLNCLHMYHIKDARLSWVNENLSLEMTT